MKKEKIKKKKEGAMLYEELFQIEEVLEEIFAKDLKVLSNEIFEEVFNDAIQKIAMQLNEPSKHYDELFDGSGWSITDRP
jgi:hypothetical protein